MRNIAINGFDRIGRLLFRAIVEQGLLGKDVAVVALNDLVPADNLAYFVKEANADSFAQALAKLGDLYVNDAFWKERNCPGSRP